MDGTLAVFAASASFAADVADTGVADIEQDFHCIQGWWIQVESGADDFLVRHDQQMMRTPDDGAH